jgi:hypothetical protein
MKSDLKPTKPKTREEWLARFTEASRPLFKQAGHPLPKRVRCSVGFPSKGIRAKTIGECWSKDDTKDGVCEIFIRPSLQDDGSRIADVLTHELCHAALGSEEGHGKLFRRLATGLGLTGKMTATTAGPGWHAWADPIVKDLGKFPGAALGGELAGGKKKQTTRMLKLTCDQCGWACRTSAKHVHADMVCPMNAIEGCDGLLELAD